ncbi:MAG: hypothetical protein ACI9Y8_001892 [Candidatus Omnitrophota bacterium]
MKRTTAQDYFLATLLYTCLTLACFYPILPHISNALIGPPEDNMVFLWFLWHGSEALSRPDWNLMHTTMMYAPEGMGLEYANYFYVGVVVTYLLKSFLGLVTIFNLLIITSFITAGLSTYALIRYITRHHVAALVGGIVFAFNPYHFGHAEHHITLANIQFLPLVLLFVLRMLREKHLGFALLAGLSMALASWCDWNYLLYTTLLCLFIFLYRIIRHRGRVLLMDIRQFSVMAILCFALLAPILIPMISIGMANQNPANYLPGSDKYVADLWGFITPHMSHWSTQISAWVQGMNSKFTGNAWEKAVYLGLVNILLICVARIWKDKATWPYFLGLGAFMIFALGVSLHIGGRIIPAWMPYDILEKIPLFKHARNPSRIIIYAYLCLSVLVAFAWKIQFGANKMNLKKWIVAVVVATLIIVDFYQPVNAMTPVQLPACYQPILKDEAYANKDFMILDIPWDGGRYAMYQTLHGVPGLQGYLGRKFGVSLISKIPFDAQRIPLQKLILTKKNVKYIIFHKNKLDWTGKSEKDKFVYQYGTHNMVENYKKVYDVVYEDKNATTFKVFE